MPVFLKVHKFVNFIAGLTEVIKTYNMNIPESYWRLRTYVSIACLFLVLLIVSCKSLTKEDENLRERVSINDGWRFMKYDSAAIGRSADIRFPAGYLGQQENRGCQRKTTKLWN
jgi:hypothetical protein